MKRILLAVIIALSFSGAFAQTQVGVSNLSTHIGETVTVADKVINISYNEQLKETYLTVGNEQSITNLTVIVKETSGKKLNDWVKNLTNSQDVCVSGKLYQYQGKTSILISNASQLKLSLMDNIVKQGFN